MLIIENYNNYNFYFLGRVVLLILFLFFSFSSDTSAQTTAAYKINEAKDEQGNVLSSVKIYVDDVYVHHYAPETLTFCQGCKCDTYVDCDYGSHIFKLEKNGYSDWIDNKTISEGDSYEVDPVLLLISPTPTFTPTPTAVPSNTPTPTATVVSTPAPASYSNILISEFMADPESGDEWVELLNSNSYEVSLSNWYIDDLADNNNPPRSVSGNISAGGYEQFYIGSPFLNNDGDDVRLLDASQSEKDKKSYSLSTKGKSWSKDSSGDWCQTDPTPDSANPDCPSPTSAPAPTNTPLLAPTKTPTPTKITTPSPTPVSTEEGKLNLAGETSGNSSILGAQTSPTEPPKKTNNKQKIKITSGIFIISGLILLGFSVFFVLKEKLIESNSPQ